MSLAANTTSLRETSRIRLLGNRRLQRIFVRHDETDWLLRHKRGAVLDDLSVASRFGAWNLGEASCRLGFGFLHFARRLLLDRCSAGLGQCGLGRVVSDLGLFDRSRRRRLWWRRRDIAF